MVFVLEGWRTKLQFLHTRLDLHGALCLIGKRERLAGGPRHLDKDFVERTFALWRLASVTNGIIKRIAEKNAEH